MKKNALFVILIIISRTVCSAQGNKIHSAISNHDRKYYILTLDKGIVFVAKTSPPFDRKKYFYALTKVTLFNNGNDTLKYINMTCSWDEAFITNNRNINIAGWGCDSNFPTVYKIPPHKSVPFDIPFLIARNLAGKKLRVGFYLIKPDKRRSIINDFEIFWRSRKSFSDCLIWSNEVTIPK
ncbi:MAG TPA: hypothetical protein VG367_08205 [Mucilaginibacter sp.]|jgi:hypothetical protein|nr:hypothetical protein [Mucilaginibacter sp.]